MMDGDPQTNVLDVIDMFEDVFDVNVGHYQ